MMNTFKIKVNYLTYIVIILFLYSGFKNNLLYIVIIFIIHELGHVFFCRLLRVKIISIEIYPFGGIIKLNSLINDSILKKFLISSGGIIFQLGLFVLNFLFFKNSVIYSYNLYFLFINIIPVIPLDGSKIVQNLLCLFFPYYLSLIVTCIISVISLVFVSFFIKNITFFVFSLVFIIRDLKNIYYYFNKFLLERYLYNFNYKKCRYYKRFNLKKLQISRSGYFYENGWKNEKYFLSKIFDKNL